MGIIKEIKLLFTAQAWIRSWGVKAGGAAVALGAIQTWLSTKDGVDMVAMLATVLHLMPATLGGGLMALVGLIIWLLRIKTEWSLREVVTGADQKGTPNDAQP